MLEITNRDRANFAWMALDGYAFSKGIQAEEFTIKLGDFLTDLHHLAMSQGVDLDIAVAQSRETFLTELEEDPAG